MNIRSILLFTVFVSYCHFSHAQEKSDIVWWNPTNHEFNVIEGQGWPEEIQSGYDRLPEKAKGAVRTPVWDLSKHSAGLLIRFRSNAGNIVIRYQVDGGHAMPHMPATGVSGVDLYAKNSDGEWMWCRGNYSFGDTIKYNFQNINPNDTYHELGREYHLYLPLYNSVKWLEIGVPENTLFRPTPVRQEKPIVVYGTSIAQGACASRPGMAWTSILHRKMDRPLINLGFSGNGRLEPEVIDLLAEIDAKIYVLDCLPNLGPNLGFSLEEVYKRIISSVKRLREKRSSTPILLIEHAGYADGVINSTRQSIYTNLNKTLQEAFTQLKAEGITNIHLLPKAAIDMGMESYVDGTHPTDLGMMEYATAYEQHLREILHEPMGTLSTTIPITQSREPHNYDWEQRHQKLLTLNKTQPPKICFFGNSITHFWGGNPEAPIRTGADSWDKYLEGLEVRNFGFGWDRVENVLWRIYHDELHGFKAEQIVVMLGTNNIHLNSDEEILLGLELVIQAIQNRQPNARVSLIGLFPRKENEKRIHTLNLMIAQLSANMNVHFVDIGKVLLNDQGKINDLLFSDGLHPNAAGYHKLAPLLRDHLSR
ncbi:SGNH/GDSL hydrolase family protein [Fulvivirgaceae bacterium BMA10]|uniref:SGNH/GDSL hydrolase family protein n=1 Tax=Splendidivirga corallicola TaxID=3051826 RepID=A0ABT8KPF1_9BACT|nr:SGNH/GDSL hydrolase family protein [Fulvivirgaceae bacterium BMA10]